MFKHLSSVVKHNRHRLTRSDPSTGLGGSRDVKSGLGQKSIERAADKVHVGSWAVPPAHHSNAPVRVQPRGGGNNPGLRPSLLSRGPVCMQNTHSFDRALAEPGCFRPWATFVVGSPSILNPPTPYIHGAIISTCVVRFRVRPLATTQVLGVSIFERQMEYFVR